MPLSVVREDDLFSHLEDDFRKGEFQMNTETIWTSKGSIQRIVRSKRIWKDAMVGAIHDKGYLVMVRFAIDGWKVGWTPLHVIRRISQ